MIAPHVQDTVLQAGLSLGGSLLTRNFTGLKTGNSISAVCFLDFVRRVPNRTYRPETRSDFVLR
jgi:hypothetical protein